MNDATTTINDLKKQVQKIIQDRAWEQFHDPKNISMMIITEAAELVEIFRWAHSDKSRAVLEEKRAAVEHEIADIAFGIFAFCYQNNIDLSKAFAEKMAVTMQRYPVEKVKGKSDKYTEY